MDKEVRDVVNTVAQTKHIYSHLDSAIQAALPGEVTYKILYGKNRRVFTGEQIILHKKVRAHIKTENNYKEDI